MNYMGTVHNLSLYASGTVLFHFCSTLIKLSECSSGFYAFDVRTFQQTYIRLNFVTKPGIMFGY